jgi:hypothetical protein
MVSLLVASPVLMLFKSPLGAWSLCLALLLMLALWFPHPIFRGWLVLPGIVTVGDLAVCLGKGMSSEQSASPNSRPPSQFP